LPAVARIFNRRLLEAFDKFRFNADVDMNNEHDFPFAETLRG
jgi:hypothetical protein